MSNADGMDQAITKREFHEVLKNLFGYLDGRFEALENRFDKRFEAVDKRFDELRLWLKSDFTNTLRTELEGTLRSHVGANSDQMRREVGLVDDRYRDLPERVTKLEAKVFAPKRQRRR